VPSSNRPRSVLKVKGHDHVNRWGASGKLPRLVPTSDVVPDVKSLRSSRISTAVIPPFAPYFMLPTMAQSSSTAAQTAPYTSATQQGDNIAHALAGAGGGLLSMTLTSVPPRHYPALCLTDFSCIAIP